jgi:glutathione S-transferase
MILYGLAASSFSRKVMIAAAEKGLPLEVAVTFPGSEGAEFRAASPLGKVPAVQDGDFALADSSAICGYFEKKQPLPALYPAEAQAYGRALWLEEFADTVLGAATGKFVMQSVFLPMLRGVPGDQALIEAARDREIPAALAYLEGVAPAEGFLLGDFGIADIAMVTQLINVLLMTDLRVDAGRWPAVAALLDRQLARPSVAAAVAATQAFIEGMKQKKG